jgi:eukaryotic-like serine/threonine-protein kinase
LTETVAAGRYDVQRELGRGGMAQVYLARDRELDRPVALKVLMAHLGDDDGFRRRFLREARLAGRLSHPNVVRVYDAGESEGRPYIVMEYVPGRSLAECGRLAPERVAELGRQACAGLQHAHDAGLVHRDIKPANLLLREDGVLKITDFGIARAAEMTRQTQAGTILGTAAYLAPEQIAGEDATRSADIYSLGAVLYELLAGRPPYVFDSLAELAAQQAAGVLVPVGDVEPVPPEVEAAVMHALARDPHFRPASAADLAEEFSPVLGPPAEARTRRRERFRDRARWLWLAVAVAAAVAAVVLGVARIRGGSGSAPPPAQPRVTPPARGSTPAAEARNLARWLRAHAR